MTTLTVEPHSEVHGHRPKRRWGVHLGRLLYALLAVAIVSTLYSRFAGDDPTALPTAAAPAAAKTLEQSATELEVKASRDPGNATTWQQLTQVYVQRAAQTLDPRFYGRAESALATARDLAPDDSGTLGASAALSASLHHFADAERDAASAVAVDPYDSAAMAVLVDAQVELGRYDDAERSLQAFANRKPGAPVLSRVSYLRELHGDAAGARAAMAEARQAAAGAGSFQRATLAAYDGDLLLSQGDTDGASTAYDEALSLEPRHPIATVGHARVLAATGKADEAIALLATFVERTPVPAAATLLGELQERAGQADDARQSYDVVRALTALQADAGVDVDLDLVLFDADHSTPSPESVAKARAAFVDRPTVHGADALAWTLYRAGDVGGARDLLTRSLALGSADPLLHFHAAAILDAAGDRESARNHLQRVIDTNPQFSFALQDEAVGLASRLGLVWPSTEGER